MLQIIGWVLCSMLFASGVAMFGNPAYAPKEGDHKRLNGPAQFAALFSIIMSLVFAFWLYAQGRPINDMASGAAYPAEYGDANYDLKSAKDVEAEADAAMEAGRKAAEEARKAMDAARE